ncbi:hypothetical protein GJAV_G00246460 [Gymnothorax javanicus]|nr:hypothetical protein GJAV_G00246460 [Gymnothorax javanicus]
MAQSNSAEAAQVSPMAWVLLGSGSTEDHRATAVAEPKAVGATWTLRGGLRVETAGTTDSYAANMVLHTRHFPNASLRVLNNLSWGLVYPCYWLLNHLVASLITTTQEQQQCTQDPCASLTPCVLLITPLYLFCMILWLPIGLLGFLVWAPLQALRRPYIYSHRRVGHGEKGLDEWKLQQQSFNFATANVCLLPESLARFNNLSDTQGRACEVGRRIFGGACRPKNKISVSPPTSCSVSAASSQTFSFDKKPSSMESLTPLLTGSGDTFNNSPSHHTSPQFKRCAGTKRHSVSDGINHEISAIFPANLDFLCLQEVFDRQATVKLKQQLHHYFPFILSDVGHYAWKGCCSRFKFFNSGLFLASQYPILDVEYHCYPNGRGEDAFASKGVLFVKVQVGKSSQGERVVGYIACTHLHSIEGHSIKDKVAFDVILGDLNFDNCSSVDKLEQQHILFSHYKDPCRLRPGEDHCWAIGTLLEISGLYDEEVFTPERMQKVMESEQGRKEYLAYPTGEKNSHDQEGQKTPLKGNGRRIDYILYSEEGLQQDWKVAVEEYSFITQLAGLTDHLAVAMRLNVSAAEEEP